MLLTALDPPVDRNGTMRRWRCDYCREVGTLDVLQDEPCSYVYLPCSVCGQSPECAPDCKGIRDLLRQPGIYIAGLDRPKSRH